MRAVAGNRAEAGTGRRIVPGFADAYSPLLRRWFTALVLVLFVALVIAMLAYLLGPIAWAIAGRSARQLQPKDRADVINGVRQTLIAAAGGVAAVLTVAIAGLQWLESRRKDVASQIAAADIKLRSSAIEDRAEGVIAIRHLMSREGEVFRRCWTYLLGFVQARVEVRRQTSEGAWMPLEDREPVPHDVALALQALVATRRPLRLRYQMPDFDRALLPDIDLHDARLEGFRFIGADLRNTNLSGANLERAVLTEADLTAARLNGANLRGAKLDSAILHGATIKRAHLEGADLSGAVGLLRYQLDEAFLDKHTKLPS